MMTLPIRRSPLAALLLLAVAAPGQAAPADQVRTRVEGYRALGATYKAVNDGLRAPSPSLPAMQTAATRIRNAAALQYRWFPAGSGPQPGVKTGARPEIWAQPARFRAAQDAFAAQAVAFDKAVKGGDFAAIKSASRTLGATCKGCHDQFRNED